MQKQWDIMRPDPAVVERIQHRLQCHPVTAAVMANRQIANGRQALEFVHPGLANLPSPTDLVDTGPAVERIYAALRQEEKILVFGDYDVDGTTATSVLVTFLQQAGGQVAYYIPDRLSEGYGLKAAHVHQLAWARQIPLMITVDCGIASWEAAQTAKRLGVDLIVTDHHNLGEKLPVALAVINPKRPESSDALRPLAGVGVAFYLVMALRAYLREKGWWKSRSEPNLKYLCDLVALGTVADMVPLTGVNRTLVKTGLQVINTSPRPGIRALQQASGVSSKLVAEDISFRLAPRINAAGRMARATEATALLMAPSLTKGADAAQRLNHLNSRRQLIEEQIIKQITATLNRQPHLLDHQSLVVAGHEWHEGVLGIVAAKLAARHHRPVVVLSHKDGTAKGSARSIKGIDLFKALSQCADLLDQFGGHAMAAGLTLRTDRIDELRTVFDQTIRNAAAGRDLTPVLHIDSEIRLDQIDDRLLDELEALEPFGPDNDAPLLMARNVQVLRSFTIGGKHRRMQLNQGGRTAAAMEAIHFNPPRDRSETPQLARIAFRPQWNRWNGKKQRQLVVVEC